MIWGRQEVDILLAVNYSINQETAQKLYRTVGTEYYQNIVYPRLLEGTKAIFAEYTAEQLISNREILSEQIANIVVPSVSQYGIVVSSMIVQNIDFTDAFTNAVEAKQVAQQNKLTAQTQQDQLTMEAEQEANRQVIKAQADAEQARIAAQADLEVTKIQADAAEYAGQKEAMRIKAISQALTPDVLKYYHILQFQLIKLYYQPQLSHQCLSTNLKYFHGHLQILLRLSNQILFPFRVQI